MSPYSSLSRSSRSLTSRAFFFFCFCFFVFFFVFFFLRCIAFVHPRHSSFLSTHLALPPGPPLPPLFSLLSILSLSSLSLFASLLLLLPLFLCKMDVSVPSLVVDIGSLSTRVGYAGEDCPRQIHQSCVGIPESPSSSSSDQPSGASSSPSSCAYRFPLSFVEKRLHLSVEPCLYPVFPSSPSASSSSLPSYYFHEDAFECILRGSVEGGGPSSSSSSLSTRLLQHSSSSSRLLCPKKKKKGAADLDTHGAFLPLELCGLGESFTDTPILFSEPNLHCVSVREKIAEIVFETFDIPALYMVPRALLSCFSVGRTTGMVIDIGAASTSITPVVDGFSLHRECGEWPVGGNFLDRLLGCVFSRHRLPLLPLFSTYKRSRVLSFLQNTSSSSSSSAFSSSSSQHALRSLDHEKHRGRSQPHHHHHQPTSAFSSSSSSPTTKGGGGGGGQSTRGKGASMSSSLLANEALKRRHHLDWTGVNEVYLHYSQNAALRYMRESFCRVFPGLHHPNQHLLPAGTSSGSVSSSSASSNGGGLDDLHNKKGEGGGCPTPGYRTISPLVLPPPPPWRHLALLVLLFPQRVSMTSFPPSGSR